MAIETICQGCSKKLRVSDEHAGKQARCPECGTIYIVPSPSISTYSLIDEIEASPAPLATPQPVSNSFANPPAKPTGDRWWMKIDDGREFGPVDRLTLDGWYAERRIGPTTQLKREFDQHWQPAGNVFPALMQAAHPSSPAASSVSNPFAERPAYNSFDPTVATASGSMAYREPHRGALILVLAIIGWVTCFFLGAAAWAMGSADLAKMRAGRMDASGEGLTRAGMIIGAIQTVIGLLIMLFVMFVMFVAIMNG